MSLCTFRRPRIAATSSVPAISNPGIIAAKWKQDWVEATRLLWEKLHRRALRHSGKDDTEWLTAWAATLPCPECRHHWNALLLQSPPDWSHYFVWTVSSHNRVNIGLGKPTWTLQQALARWGS